VEGEMKDGRAMSNFWVSGLVGTFIQLFFEIQSCSVICAGLIL
jgi:hypothetical protein